MAITVDAIGSINDSFNSGVTTASYTGLTTTSATTTNNGAIIVFIWSDPGFSTPSTVVWDLTGANKSFTLIGSVNDVSLTGSVEMWGLVNPTSYGNKTITITSPIANNGYYQVCAMSLTGVNQTGGTTTFANFTSNAPSTATTTYSITCSSSIGNMVIAAVETGENNTNDISSPTQTAIFTDNSGVPWAASYAAGAASVTSSWSDNMSSTFGAIAVSVLAASGVVFRYDSDIHALMFLFMMN